MPSLQRSREDLAILVSRIAGTRRKFYAPEERDSFRLIQPIPLNGNKLEQNGRVSESAVLDRVPSVWGFRREALVQDRKHHNRHQRAVGTAYGDYDGHGCDSHFPVKGIWKRPSVLLQAGKIHSPDE